MEKTKKIINAGDDAVSEMLEGILSAHPAEIRALEASPRSIIVRDGPRPGKVGMVVGGGSGHEPTFLGFVGKGLADGAAIGNVFASPPPDPILACAKAVDGGAGVLFVYGNYAGDVMNFDMAAEMAAMDDIEVRTVVTTDDVASAPPNVPTLTPVAHERLFRVWRWRKRSIRRVLDRHCGARGIPEWLFRVRRRS